MIQDQLTALAEGQVWAPLGGLLIGMLLSLSPVSLPGVAAALATFSPGRVATDGTRSHVPLRQSVPAVVAFVAGMDGIFALFGYLFVQVTIALTRASVALHVVAGALLLLAGARLVFGRGSLCARANAIPPTPGRAFTFGMLFSVTGCPGCGPIVVGLSSATALLAGPLPALLALAAFVLGRSLVLVSAASLGSRLLPTAGDLTWRRLDLLVGLLFLVAGGYYLYRVRAGEVTTLLPGEPGSGLLPG